MRLPRLTTRRLMVLVAVVAVLIGCAIRRQRFLAIAARHTCQLRAIAIDCAPEERDRIMRQSAYDDAMYSKYRFAARYPWLPVPPDPPMPE